IVSAYSTLHCTLALRNGYTNAAFITSFVISVIFFLGFVYGLFVCCS
ncbi:13214_t:CDS:2, partial [Cetraspora pellucida]